MKRGDIEWLKSGLEKPGKSQTGLAKVLGLRDSAISDMMRGKRRLQLDEVDLAAEYLGLEDVVPIVGIAGAGGQIVYEEAIGGDPETVPRPPKADANAVAVEIRGDSLGPGFNRWVAIYNRREEPMNQALLGQLCVVGTADGRTLVKWVSLGTSGYNLRSGDNSVEKDVELRWAAKVVHLQHRHP